MTSIDTPAAEARESNARTHASAALLSAFLDVHKQLDQAHRFAAPSTRIGLYADALLAAGWRPPASVIPADTRPYEAQTAALDALRVHTLVSYRDHDGELHTLEKVEPWRGADSVWFATASTQPSTTYNLVRNEVDYTIVRMGDGS